MAKTRKSIPLSLKADLLYKSAHTCSVCRRRELPVQIHHIDKDPSNNNEQNLIVLCGHCHDEAHTTHDLSLNLSPALLKKHKAAWQEEVAERAAYAMTASGHKAVTWLSNACWAYINLHRLLQVMSGCDVGFDQQRFALLKARGLVDQDGIPIPQKEAPKGKSLKTLYDRFDYGDDQRLFVFYNNAVERLIMAAHPIELGAIWSKTELKALLAPGALCHCIRGFRFKRGERSDQEEDREVYARANGVEVRFMVNTRFMFGSSSLYDSFVRHRVISAFLIVKSIQEEGGRLVVRCTPIAMGMGFSTSTYKPPFPLKYGWAKNQPEEPSPEEREEAIAQLRSMLASRGRGG